MTHPQQAITRFVQDRTLTVALLPQRIAITLTQPTLNVTQEAFVTPDYLHRHNLPRLSLE